MALVLMGPATEEGEGVRGVGPHRLGHKLQEPTKEDVPKRTTEEKGKVSVKCSLTQQAKPVRGERKGNRCAERYAMETPTNEEDMWDRRRSANKEPVCRRRRACGANVSTSPP